MNKRLRSLVVLAALALGGYFLYPTYTWYFNTPKERQELANQSKEEIRKYARSRAGEDFNSLIDLVKSGGDVPLPEKLSFLISVARDNYKLIGKEAPKEWTVNTILRGFQDGQAVFSALEDYYSKDILNLKEMKNRILLLGLDLSGGMSVVVEADRASLEKRIGRIPTEAEQEEAIALALEILNNRIDGFGVTEPKLRKQSNNQILIEIPGENDPERVNSFLMGKGSLNFHIVDAEATRLITTYAATNPQDVFENGRPEDPSILPPGRVVRGFYKKDRYGIDQFVNYQVIHEEPGLSGNYIQEASTYSDRITGQPRVSFRLDSEGGEIFYNFTSANVGKTLAVVMDDKIKSAAVIQEGIRDNVQVSGYSYEEAKELALVLKTAALPVDLEVVNQTSIGASLGEETIQVGLKAIEYGFIAVILFIILWYKGAGIIAAVALLFNLLLITAVLSSFNMTLTMTSIAGLILNVGMAVDANVIIFERIKEELKQGKGRAVAVEAGYKKAFWTIMDANITTFIAAIFLSQLGRGPVQGFAITLAVGIVCSLFTAIFVSHLFFDLGTEFFKRKKVSIAWRLK